MKVILLQDVKGKGKKNKNQVKVEIQNLDKKNKNNRKKGYIDTATDEKTVSFLSFDFLCCHRNITS